jgi:hypothetical protein
VLTTELPCLQEVPPTEPVDQSDEREWDTVGGSLGVVAQPPLSKSSWRRWSASPLLVKRARSPQLPLQKKWWPQKRSRALHQLLVLQKG